MVVEGDAAPSEGGGSANHSSRWNSKRPTERQTRRVDIDEEAEDDEVAYQFCFVKWCKRKATTQVGVVDGAGTSSAAAAEGCGLICLLSGTLQFSGLSKFSSVPILNCLVIYYHLILFVDVMIFICMVDFALMVNFERNQTINQSPLLILYMMNGNCIVAAIGTKHTCADGPSTLFLLAIQKRC
ncbi:uncharacterized protein LOC119317626 [Triticum dicoccoides]|uniref:uncharacterized protein LOC119317626 n=1 Tax=Triticum dicoccoides TaxID=85692 RepID=UPI001891839F|nr:uncharacterized protein LOC119317626 [Triticum dicoccoides]